jgi:ABC-type dipeptide/oligopeptide/nickel transport systems, permease components
VLTYIVRRILYSIPVLIVSTFLIFSFVSLAGDPRANMLANPQFSAVTYKNLEHKYHLDQPIPVRYGYWVQDVFTTSSAFRCARRSRSGPTSRARSPIRRR